MKKYCIGVFMFLFMFSVTEIGLVQGEMTEEPPKEEVYIILSGNTISGEHMEIGEIEFTVRQDVKVTSLQLAVRSLLQTAGEGFAEVKDIPLPIFEAHHLTYNPPSDMFTNSWPGWSRIPHRLYFQLDRSMTPDQVVLVLTVEYNYPNPNPDAWLLALLGTFEGKITPDVSMSAAVAKMMSLLGDRISSNVSQIYANGNKIDANQGSIAQNGQDLAKHDLQIQGVLKQADLNTERIITLEGFHSNTEPGGKSGKKK